MDDTKISERAIEEFASTLSYAVEVNFKDLCEEDVAMLQLVCGNNCPGDS